VKIRAPAKINFSLRVVGRRVDGYHLIDSIMLPVTLFDEIEIKKALRRKSSEPALRVTCDDARIPPGEENLAYRAAALLLEEFEVAQALDIHIRKRIPIGAGLGGGSTDAAAVLVGLNRLLKLGLSERRLEKIGLRLGADVPFFIRGEPARARGIGEKLSPIRNVPRWWLVIAYPGFAVSSAWAYGKMQANLTKLNLKNRLYTLLTRAPEFADLIVNDLEAVTVKRYPAIKSLKESLVQLGATGASMTGSGSAVFGVFGSREKAKKAQQALSKLNHVEAFLAQVISRST
jgi:4-diphosphocytidyl-2-C-methyl-D-erythritol kinase